MEIQTHVIKNLIDNVINELRDTDEATNVELSLISDKLLDDEDFVAEIIDNIFYRSVNELYNLRENSKEE